MTQNSSLKFLALGDSYTIGEGISEAQCWPVQLVSALRECGWQMANPSIIARTGWTTSELAKAIQKAKLKPGYNLVSLGIGVNNQYRGLSPDMYRVEFAQLLHEAVLQAGDDPSRVFVISIPDWGVTPFAAGRHREKIAAEIELFNTINRQETANQGAEYLDITPISRRAEIEAELLTSDQLHPSGKMYAAWVRLILPCAIQILKRQGFYPSSKPNGQTTEVV